MKKIQIFDSYFIPNHKSSCINRISKNIEWYYDEYNFNSNIIFYTDYHLKKVENSNAKYNYAWLIEPPEIYSESYKLFFENKSNPFNKVFTYHKKLLDKNPSVFLFYPMGGSWINDEYFNLYNKSKLVSMITSGKLITSGHDLRYKVISKYRNKIDLFGKKYKYLENKAEGLANYMFSIEIENSSFDYYFTEKIIDSFLCGTIPIYWGCPSIGKFFDINGIFQFNNLDELENIMNSLSEELYISRLASIKKNFELAKKYLLSEDYLYNNYKFVFK